MSFADRLCRPDLAFAYLHLTGVTTERLLLNAHAEVGAHCGPCATTTTTAALKAPVCVHRSSRVYPCMHAQGCTVFGATCAAAVVAVRSHFQELAKSGYDSDRRLTARPLAQGADGFGSAAFHR